jgi:hypothetical protein
VNVIELPDFPSEDSIRRIVREELQRANGERSPWLNVAGAAEYAAMTPDAIRSAEKRGQVKGHRGTTGRLRFRVDDLDAFLGAGEAV